jgi:hypothetical protein
MKKFVLSVLCALVSVSALGQGTIQLSNIGKTIVTVDGAAAPAGTTVQYATGVGELVGTSASILGAGYFSAGSTTLDGLTGTVNLHLAGHTGDSNWSYSDAFEVTLGGSGTPPAPPAALPNGVALDISATPAIPEPSTIALAVLGGTALLFRLHRMQFLFH